MSLLFGVLVDGRVQEVNIPGAMSDLVEIVKKVQQYRFKAASKRGERKLPKIKPEYVHHPFLQNICLSWNGNSVS